MAKSEKTTFQWPKVRRLLITLPRHTPDFRTGLRFSFQALEVPVLRVRKSHFHCFSSLFLSELHELEFRICVQPNSPIIILILLNGFHKFAMSMGPNTSDSSYRRSWRTTIRNINSKCLLVITC